MKIHWQPQKKQAQALARTEKEILFGGSRGGGKTDAGQAWLMYEIDKPEFRGLVIRRNFTDLADWIDRAVSMFYVAGGKLVGDTFTFPSGAKIRTGHLDSKDAYQKYQGHEYQKMLIEELTHIPRESDYIKLLGSLRSTSNTIKPQVFCTTNPDGSGYEWVKERWGIPDEPKEMIITQTEDGNRVFIPSTVWDNNALIEKDPNYVKYLQSIPDPELRRAWLEGSWAGFGVEGSYYRDHMQRVESDGRIVENLYEPTLPVYTWCDLGIADSFSIGYFQVTGNKWRVIDFDEFEGESLGDAINRMRMKGYTYAEHYAPHDIEVRELGSGKTRLELAQSLGVYYNVAPKMGIADGINALRMRFPQLWFDKEKTKALRNKLMRYRKEYDEARGIWKDKPYHDTNSHAADMMRYWAVTQIFTIDHDTERRIQENRANPKTFK